MPRIPQWTWSRCWKARLSEAIGAVEPSGADAGRSRRPSFRDAAGGVPCEHRVVRDVLRHDGPCAYDAPVAYGDPREHGDVGSNPAVLSDCYRLASHDVRPPLLVVHRMNRGHQVAVRPYLGVVPYSDTRGVQEGAVVVHEDVLSEVYVESEVAPERKDDYSATCGPAACDVLEGRNHLIPGRHRRGVVLLDLHRAVGYLLHVFSI